MAFGERRTPMPRGGPLRQVSARRQASSDGPLWSTLTRVPFQPSAVTGVQATRAPLRQVSEKRAAENRLRTALLARLRAERPLCEARFAPDCSGQSQDGHEPGMRSRGADPLDSDQVIMVCRSCHQAIHDNPRAATAAGLLIPSWARRGEVPVDDP